jgi:hypothetical protein
MQRGNLSVTTPPPLTPRQRSDEMFFRDLFRFTALRAHV